jgi:hypothetical protein
VWHHKCIYRDKEIKKRTIKFIIKIHKERKQTRRSVMANAIETTEERITTVAQENVETQKKEMSKAEICFGALMAIAAIAGMWGVVSLMISMFLN